MLTVGQSTLNIIIYTLMRSISIIKTTLLATLMISHLGLMDSSAGKVSSINTNSHISFYLGNINIEISSISYNDDKLGSAIISIIGSNKNIKIECIGPNNYHSKHSSTTIKLEYLVSGRYDVYVLDNENIVHFKTFTISK